MEKLLVNDFAGLKSVELDIRPVTGLIGPQASGKSIIAKLLYFFREIASRLPAAVLEGQEGPQYKAECCKRFSRYFPIENTGVSDFAISYLSNREKVRVNFTNREGSGEPSLGLEWTSFYDSTLEKFALRKREVLGAIGDAEKDAITAANRALRDEVDRDITSALGTWAKYEQIFIPAGRAFFSQVRSTVFTRLETGESLDPFVVAFGSMLEQSKSVLESRGFFGGTEGPNVSDTARFDALRTAFEEILRARLKRFEKQEFLEFADGRRVKLSQASSGQQEALPLLLLLARFVSLGHARGRAVYIEEPEAHLFPSTQKLIMELMAQVFRARNGEMCIVLTTHSPYILTSVNNQLQAGKLYTGASKEASKRLAQILPRKRTFSPGEVSFYALEDGKAKSILNGESGLIEADVIDQVSNDIAIQFDKLLSEENEKS
jgi:hypothetical protein